MMDFLYFAGLAVTGFGAGLLGSLLGLGGGVFVVPALVLLFGIPQPMAIGASNVAVVATSTGGASTYVRTRLTNIRLGLLLLISTTLAAVVSSLVVSYLPSQVLSGLFAIMLFYVSFTMFRSRNTESVAVVSADEARADGEHGLVSTYTDRLSGQTVLYRPRNVRTGMGLSAIAGVAAGLLGVGGGPIQMPVMTLLMGVPVKVATATSNFIIGVTAAGAAFIRYAHGDINPLIAAPIAIFVFWGARVGAWLVPRIPNARLKTIFGWVAIVIALLMLRQAFGLFTGPGK